MEDAAERNKSDINNNDGVIKLQLEQNRFIDTIIQNKFSQHSFPCELHSAIKNGIINYSMQQTKPNTKPHESLQSSLVGGNNENIRKSKCEDSLGKTEIPANRSEKQHTSRPSSEDLIGLQTEQNRLLLSSTENVVKHLPDELRKEFLHSLRENVISLSSFDENKLQPEKSGVKIFNSRNVEKDDNLSGQDNTLLDKPPKVTEETEKSNEYKLDNTYAISQDLELIELQISQNNLMKEASIIPNDMTSCMSLEMEKLIKMALNKNVQILSSSNKERSYTTTDEDRKSAVFDVSCFRL